jgi:hypothetical protein
MLHHGLDFHAVRVLCANCGWFRNIAHSGCADGLRALVQIERAKDPSHVLHAKVIEMPETVPLADAMQAHPGYRDLVADAHEKGLLRMEDGFAPLVADQSCPRCKTIGALKLSLIWNLGSHVRY